MPKPTPAAEEVPDPGKITLIRYQDGGSLLPHKVEAGSVVEQFGWIGEEVIGVFGERVKEAAFRLCRTNDMRLTFNAH